MLPEREIRTVEELLELFPGVRDLLIDGTQETNPETKKQRETKRKPLWQEENTYLEESDHL
jgi:hypothetical protein